MLENSPFREDREIEESKAERLGLFERNMVQVEILLALGFKPREVEKSVEETTEEGEWMANHRQEISEVMDSSEYATQIHELAAQGEFAKAATIVIEVLNLSR